MLNEIIEISDPSKGGFLLIVLLVGEDTHKNYCHFPKTKVIGIDRDKTVFSISKKT